MLKSIFPIRSQDICIPVFYKRAPGIYVQQGAVRQRPMHSSDFPRVLWIGRHGQSAGNVARDGAEAQGIEVIDIATRDIDVPLSDWRRQQTESLGRWFGELKS